MNAGSVSVIQLVTVQINSFPIKKKKKLIKKNKINKNNNNGSKKKNAS